jgi:cation transport ATPase
MDLVRIGFVVLAAVAVWFRIWEPFPHISVVGILATVGGGYPIFKEAFENILERKMTMELSMTIALLAALAIGELGSSARFVAKSLRFVDLPQVAT